MKNIIYVYIKYFTAIVIFVFSTDLKASVICGDERTSEYFNLIKDKKIGIFTNHTGIAGDIHIVDLLVNNGFEVKFIFSPEHGFRGDADAGEKVDNYTDSNTEIPVYSLFNHKGGKPDVETMEKIDIIIVDIQDVGLRFYTYYITMYKLMEACSDSEKTMLLLDRPNPNGFYVDGPVMDMKHKSGVGYLQIPVVHGMTLGELALMINGEQWLTDGKHCDLQVIKCKNYTHDTYYKLDVPPSPNLPNMRAIYLYPSICLFEGTKASLGRGTDFPFQVYGSPSMKGNFHFTPHSKQGAKKPQYMNQKCFGVDLRKIPCETIRKNGLDLKYIIDAYKKMNIGEKFFTPFFEKLTGVDYIRRMIIEGKSAAEIKSQWKDDVERFKELRKKYLLY
ncbi:MAG: DUF1343 domain-containing protein [Dysgonamonadaceae bacterium]|jgi:uncharacterized protein YbbC (DUF1343 family)|nr:DUF1343 domain-containing protein [Dysgonamonadaceae bacterium]